ncbi:Endoglucanase (EC [Lentimonas sp. CC19]|nr:Endoglucanase (EC [Lentimonas sp. CC19]CAA6690840.1 Endoglucanase (EC [Lentimonas sp. CC10]CAA7068497.1 Endoglucanase (EC [Lentimonas sp. CC11]
MMHMPARIRLHRLSILLLIMTSAITPLRADSNQLAFSRNQALAQTINLAERSSAESDVSIIAEAGFTAIRLVLAPFKEMQQDEGQWRFNTAWLKDVERIVERALQHDLAIILDHHEYFPMGEKPEEMHDQYMESWRLLAQHFAHLPNDTVFFELLNEPNTNLTPKLWNTYLAEAIAVVRKSNPERTLIIGPGHWNNIKFLKQLKIPKSERNVIATFHYYEPFQFTHQGASWTPNMKDVKDVRWNGTPEQIKEVLSDLQSAAQWGKKEQRPLLLGEFGAIKYAALEDRVRYYHVVHTVAEKYGISWAAWGFRDGHYSIYDSKKAQWNQALLYGLRGKPTQ